MKKRSYRLASILLALLLVICLIPAAAFAEGETGTETTGTEAPAAEEKKVEKLAYDGDTCAFYKEDLLSAFAMLAPQEGSTCEIDGDDVVIHIVPKSTTTYNAIHWGAITDELTKDVTFNEDGTIDLKLAAADYCGYAHPIAPIKAADGGTSKDQYYLAIPAADKLPKAASEEPVTEDPVTEAPETEAPSGVEKLAYDGDALAFYKEDLSSAFGMLTPQEGSTCEIDGDNVVIHIIPKNTTVYNSWHWGAITDELTKDVTFNEDGTIDLKLAAADYCGYASPIAPIKVKDGATSSDQYYLAIPAKDKLPEAEPETKASSVELAITNNVNMFKVVTASVETAEDGTKTLVIALNGKGYENLFKGDYEQAKANGNDRTKWIASETNADGKLEFRVPVTDDEKLIPIVAISKSYVEKFDAGENPIERAFFPRQMELDTDAKTLVVSDYESSKDIKVINNVKMFKPESAKLTTVGGPNSNDYATTLDLLMGSDAFDKAFIGAKDEAAAASDGVIAVDGRTFSFKLRWIKTAGQPDTTVDLMKDPITISFHSVKNDAWYERVFVVSESKGTVTINPAAEDDGSGVKVISIKDKNSDPVPFSLDDVKDQEKLTIPVAVKVNPDVDNPDSIEIKWQKDIVIPEGTEFPITVEFEYKNKSQNFFIYHYDTEKKVWEVAGQGKEGKAVITFDKFSPVALVAVNTPNTGDHSAPWIWGAAAVVSAAAAMVLAVRRRKEEQ